jgi:hypothetical protein
METAPSPAPAALPPALAPMLAGAGGSPKPNKASSKASK